MNLGCGGIGTGVNMFFGRKFNMNSGDIVATGSGHYGMDVVEGSDRDVVNDNDDIMSNCSTLSRYEGNCG